MRADDFDVLEDENSPEDRFMRTRQAVLDAERIRAQRAADDRAEAMRRARLGADARLAAWQNPERRDGTDHETIQDVARWLLNDDARQWIRLVVLDPVLGQNLKDALQTQRALRAAFRKAEVERYGATPLDHVLRQARGVEPDPLPERPRMDFDREAIARWVVQHRTVLDLRVKQPPYDSWWPERAARWAVARTITALASEYPATAVRLHSMAQRAVEYHSTLPPTADDAAIRRMVAAELDNWSFCPPPQIAVATDHEDESEEDETAEERDQRRLRGRVLYCIRKNPGCGNSTLREKVRGRRGVAIVATARTLEAEGLLRNTGTASRPIYHVVETEVQE